MLHLYQVLVTALVVLIFLNVANNLHLLSEAVPRGELPQPLPLVSVLVPARNEERNIGPCLSSLLAQDYANLEILVLDDDSSDRTAQMVEEYARKDARLRLLKGAPLLQGWHGKAYACHQLAQAARGEYLLFTDADTVHTPHSVSWTLRLAKERGADLVTYFPRLVTESFWEKTIMPIMHFGILSYLPLGLVERSQNPWFSMALGPFMFFGREFYQGIGGHAAVKDEIAEDVALGRLVKKAGGHLLLTDGTEVLRVRFYHSLGEIWRGFTKSAFAAADYSAPALLGLLVLNFFLFLLPYYFLYLWLFRGHSGLDYELLPLLQVALGFGIRLMLAQHFRQARAFVLLHPLSVTMGILLSLDSIRCSPSRGGTNWKGRTYSAEDGYLVHRHSE